MSGRRTFLGHLIGSTAAVAAIGAAAPLNPDAELLALIGQWRTANDIVLAYPDLDSATREGQAVFDKLCAAEGDAAAEVIDTAAETLAGIRAKAEVLRVLLYRYHDTSIEEGCAGDEIHLVVSLCDDLVGAGA